MVVERSHIASEFTHRPMRGPLRARAHFGRQGEGIASCRASAGKQARPRSRRRTEAALGWGQRTTRKPLHFSIWDHASAVKVPSATRKTCARTPISRRSASLGSQQNWATQECRDNPRS
eukprot:3477376-Pyramimonas_sp.AAC.1